MSVLTCVLEEELDRLQRHRVLVIRDLQEDGISDKRRELLQQSLQRIPEDMCRIRRVLAPVDRSQIDELGFEIQEGRVWKRKKLTIPGLSGRSDGRLKPWRVRPLLRLAGRSGLLGDQGISRKAD